MTLWHKAALVLLCIFTTHQHWYRYRIQTDQNATRKWALIQWQQNNQFHSRHLHVNRGYWTKQWTELPEYLAIWYLASKDIQMNATDTCYSGPFVNLSEEFLIHGWSKIKTTETETRSAITQSFTGPWTRDVLNRKCQNMHRASGAISHESLKDQLRSFSVRVTLNSKLYMYVRSTVIRFPCTPVCS